MARSRDTKAMTGWHWQFWMGEGWKTRDQKGAAAGGGDELSEDCRCGFVALWGFIRGTDGSQIRHEKPLEPMISYKFQVYGKWLRTIGPNWSRPGQWSRYYSADGDMQYYSKVLYVEIAR